MNVSLLERFEIARSLAIVKEDGKFRPLCSFRNKNKEHLEISTSANLLLTARIYVFPSKYAEAPLPNVCDGGTACIECRAITSPLITRDTYSVVIMFAACLHEAQKRQAGLRPRKKELTNLQAHPEECSALFFTRDINEHPPEPGESCTCNKPPSLFVA